VSYAIARAHETLYKTTVSSDHQVFDTLAAGMVPFRRTMVGALESPNDL